MAGNASYALLKQRTKPGLNCSILLMALCTSMVWMVQSGYAARNARKHTMWLVSAQISQNQQNGPFCVAFLSVNSKRIRVDLHVKQVITKRVTISVVVVKQKKGKPRPPKEECWGKDGRKISPRREASSGKNKRKRTGQKRTWTGLFTCGRTQTCLHKRESPKGKYLWRQGFPTLPCVRGCQEGGVEGTVGRLLVANTKQGY